uniref:Uncharacterized protein n=1 Tax=Arundo donax TaxID=35708 RepID=A0A0A8ZCH6_ARUDO
MNSMHSVYDNTLRVHDKSWKCGIHFNFTDLLELWISWSSYGANSITVIYLFITVQHMKRIVFCLFGKGAHLHLPSMRSNYYSCLYFYFGHLSVIISLFLWLGKLYCYLISFLHTCRYSTMEIEFSSKLW